MSGTTAVGEMAFIKPTLVKAKAAYINSASQYLAQKIIAQFILEAVRLADPA